MVHGATSSGKYYNGCTSADVNKGKYGKLSSDQIRERIDLHARRIIEGRPTVVEIAAHWMDKHGVEMSYQSEKTWCATPRNKAQIEERVKEISLEGTRKILPAVQAQGMLNSLAECAKETASACRAIKQRLNSALNQDGRPWSILGITESEYVNSAGPQRKMFEEKVKLLREARKENSESVYRYAKAHVEMGRELRATIKQAYDMGKYLDIVQARTTRKGVAEAKETQARIENLRPGETLGGDDLYEVDVEKARKALGYEDN